jgi:hypothetical protein
MATMRPCLSDTGRCIRCGEQAERSERLLGPSRVGKVSPKVAVRDRRERWFLLAAWLKEDEPKKGDRNGVSTDMGGDGGNGRYEVTKVEKARGGNEVGQEGSGETSASEGASKSEHIQGAKNGDGERNAGEPKQERLQAGKSPLEVGNLKLGHGVIVSEVA